MIFNNKPNKRIEHEGKEYWISRAPAVFGVIFIKKENQVKVLVCKRGPECPDHVGMWCLPCGYLDWDETGPEAVVREVHEETKLELPNFSNIIYNHLFNSNPLFVNTKPSSNNQNVSLGYGLFVEVTDWPDTSFTNDETAEIKLLDINQTDSLDFAFNHNQRIKEFIDHLKNKNLL